MMSQKAYEQVTTGYYTLEVLFVDVSSDKTETSVGISTSGTDSVEDTQPIWQPIASNAPAN